MEKTSGFIATYETHQQAEEAIRALNRAGFNMKQLSIVGKGYHSEEQPVGFYTLGDRMKTWGGVGAFWGALWGLLFGSAFFLVPGIGLLGAAGPFVHVLAGAVEGAALVGGLSVVGAALANIGVPRDAIIKYERSIGAARYLLIAHGTHEEIELARGIVESSGAVEVDPFEPADDQDTAASKSATA
jgi:hypothetical protein